MAMVISMGITSAMGYPYTPMHAALPFLALGKLHIRNQWFWQNFINSMCGIKFWKGNENLRSVYKKQFFEILSGFLGALFTEVICTFLKSVWKDGFFDTPFDLIKEKKFSCDSWVSVYFLWTKKHKYGSNHSIFRKMVFYKQVLKFHCPSKFVCQTYGLQNHWSLLHIA